MLAFRHWIPAFAGMTYKTDTRSQRKSTVSFAGMTVDWQRMFPELAGLRGSAGDFAVALKVFEARFSKPRRSVD